MNPQNIPTKFNIYLTISFFTILILIISCDKPKNENSEVSNHETNSIKSEGISKESTEENECIQFVEGTFSSEFDDGCLSGNLYEEKDDGSCTIDSLLLGKNGDGEYSPNPDESVIKMNWKKEGGSIILTGMYEAPLKEHLECAGVCSEDMISNEKFDSCLKKCDEKIMKNFGKKSVIFEINGTVTQSGKDILFSLSGKDSAPIEGKTPPEFKYTKKNEKVCVRGI